MTKTKIETICQIVCREFEVAYSDLMSNRRWQDVAEARRVAMSLSEAAAGRDATLAHFKKHYDTLKHSKRRVIRLGSTYPAFKTKVEACRKLISSPTKAILESTK